jgi:hypothetical protein
MLKALETGNSLHKENLEGVHFPGLLRDRWRALKTEHILLIVYGLRFGSILCQESESVGTLELL